MVYDPTGALVAAPDDGAAREDRRGAQLGLPLHLAPGRGFTLYALISIGFDEEARNFMGWLRDRCNADEDGLLQPLYGIDGRNRSRKTDLSHLSGYMGSSPVRLGNARLQADPARPLRGRPGRRLPIQQVRRAARLRPMAEPPQDPRLAQRELASGRRRDLGGPRGQAPLRLLQGHELGRPGAGRRISRQRGLPSGEAALDGERDRIYEEIMEKGWNPEKESFVQYYGGEALDASLLLMPLVKFVGPTDPRWLSTLDRIEEELTYDTLVDRYKVEDAAPDGLEGRRGRLQHLLLLARRMPDQAGRLDEARLALEKMFSYANHLGLYAEEVGPSGEALGNFPQALTHLSLISAAVNLDRALGLPIEEQGAAQALRGRPKLQ